MKVPDYWWKEYTTHSLNDGRIVSFDESTQKWDLLLHTQEDGDDLYPMAYAAVCEYSDKQSSSFQDFVLPVDPIFEGGDCNWWSRVSPVSTQHPSIDVFDLGRQQLCQNSFELPLSYCCS